MMSLETGGAPTRLTISQPFCLTAVLRHVVRIRVVDNGHRGLCRDALAFERSVIITTELVLSDLGDSGEQKKQKGIAECDAPLPLAGLAPPAFTATCRNQTSDAD